MTVLHPGPGLPFRRGDEDGPICWNDAGQMLVAQWAALAERFPAVEIDTFVVMPNHLHGIVWICDSKPTHEDERE